MGNSNYSLSQTDALLIELECRHLAAAAPDCPAALYAVGKIRGILGKRALVPGPAGTLISRVAAAKDPHAAQLLHP